MYPLKFANDANDCYENYRSYLLTDSKDSCSTFGSNREKINSKKK